MYAIDVGRQGLPPGLHCPGQNRSGSGEAYAVLLNVAPAADLAIRAQIGHLSALVCIGINKPRLSAKCFEQAPRSSTYRQHGTSSQPGLAQQFPLECLAMSVTNGSITSWRMVFMAPGLFRFKSGVSTRDHQQP
jgi:hypothetical protein